MPTELLNALALIKKAAATVNREQGKIDPLVANAIIKAAAGNNKSFEDEEGQ